MLARWLLVVCPLAAFCADPITYREQVAPILARRCISCHRLGEAAPMPLGSYAEVRPWAKAIREAVLTRRMPPWFADPKFGHFRNDPSLPADEIETISQWAANGAPEGEPEPRKRRSKPAPAAPVDPPLSADVVFRALRPFSVPAKGDVEYQFLIIPMPFTVDRWIERVEVRPSARGVVHHVVAYIREPGSDWLQGHPPHTYFTAGREAQTRSDLLMVYTPGHGASGWPAGMAKKIKAGSDIVLQFHYTPNGTPQPEQTSVGLTFAPKPPEYRVLTIQMGYDKIRIPPGDANYRASVSGTLPNDAILLGLYPHMHLRGKGFEYQITAPGGHVETLLKVDRYQFEYQFQYDLAQPRLLQRGTRLLVTGYFDNSANNPRNPDPTAEVEWGEQSWQEMMIGFLDIAVDPKIDRPGFFIPNEIRK
jgi:hypothetical protein